MEVAETASNRKADQEALDKGADPKVREHPVARGARDAASEKADAVVAAGVSRETARVASVPSRRIPKQIRAKVTGNLSAKGGNHHARI